MKVFVFLLALSFVVVLGGEAAECLGFDPGIQQGLSLPLA